MAGRIVYWCVVADACTVVIGAPDLLPSLKQRTLAGNDEILAFSDADALRALEVISERRPRMVALERVLPATPACSGSMRQSPGPHSRCRRSRDRSIAPASNSSMPMRRPSIRSAPGMARRRTLESETLRTCEPLD